MNRKQLLILLLVALCNPFVLSAQKQKKDSVDGYRFVYEFTYPGRNKQATDLQHLDITPDGVSVCYSRYERAWSSVTSNIGKNSKDVTEALAAWDRIKQMPKGKRGEVYKNVPEYSQLTYTETLATHKLKYTEELPAIAWSMQEGQKEVCGYACQPAEADFLGRHWTVWYTPEVPLADGPWKLHGLPGMILEAADADSLFHFTCVGMESLRLAPIALPKEKYIKCTHDELENERRKMDSDRLGYLTNAMNGKEFKVVDENGKEVKTLKVDATYIERREGDKR